MRSSWSSPSCRRCLPASDASSLLHVLRAGVRDSSWWHWRLLAWRLLPHELQEFDLSSRVSFGSFFAHPEAKIGKRVYVGSYRILGRATIGDGTLLASGVQVLSGGRQHSRGARGEAFSGGEFLQVTFGSESWIGAAATVMADVGSRTTVGAGSVVNKPVPDDCVAVGNPARVITS